MLASIIIDNYNYDKYIGETIVSALNQTYQYKEIIVVDDGSTDNSRAIIESYGDQVIHVYKKNGGQASALNAGFAESKGDFVFFLDSDDVLFPDAVKNAVALLRPGVSKVHWPLWIIDENGNKTGETKPGLVLPEGDLSEVILRGGPTSYISSPTSGNAWSREFLKKVCPLPEDVSYYKTCADEYLYTLAPVFGLIKAIQKPQGYYRIHGKNIYSALSSEKKLELELTGHEQQTIALDQILQKNGYHIDPDEWRKNSWFHGLAKAIHLIRTHIPDDQKFILVDDNTWNGEEIFGKNKALPFLEHEGAYYGGPETQTQAIEELTRMKNEGAAFIVIAKPGFWWLDHYKEFNNYLTANFKCIVRHESVIIYELNRKA